MDYIIICLAALLTSGLTLFSGFGLGTLLLPVFAIFFPIEIAITLTAVVHFLNNLFKLALMGKYANLLVVLKFGLPAIAAAYGGARLLIILSGADPLFTYTLFNETQKVELVKLVIAFLILMFAIFELIPKFDKLSFNKKYLPFGGLLSGFFGGLSGHQGALRSAFLIKMNLSKEEFIATGIVIATVIDITRLSVYSSTLFGNNISDNVWLLTAAVLSAFIGAVAGKMLLGKVTYRTVKNIVGALLIVTAIGLGMGLL